MPELNNEKDFEIEGFDGMQAITSRFVKDKAQLSYAQHARYEEIGSVNKGFGYVQRGSQLAETTSTSTSTTSTSSSTSSSTSISTTSTSSSTTTTA